MKVALLIMANLKSGCHVCVSFPLYLDLEVCVTFVTAESVAKSPQFPEHFPPTSHFDFGFQEELSEAVFWFPGNKRIYVDIFVTKKSPFMLGENRSIDVHIHIISFTLNNS